MKLDYFAPILRDELLACGIDQQNALLATRGKEAWEVIFGACGPGDLLILGLSPVGFDDAHDFIDGYAGNSRKPVSDN